MARRCYERAYRVWSMLVNSWRYAIICVTPIGSQLCFEGRVPNVTMLQPMANIGFQSLFISRRQAGSQHEMRRQRIFGGTHCPDMHMVNILHTRNGS